MERGNEETPAFVFRKGKKTRGSEAFEALCPEKLAKKKPLERPRPQKTTHKKKNKMGERGEGENQPGVNSQKSAKQKRWSLGGKGLGEGLHTKTPHTKKPGRAR